MRVRSAVVKSKPRGKVVPLPAKRAPAVSLATLASGYRLTASGPRRTSKI